MFNIQEIIWFLMIAVIIILGMVLTYGKFIAPRIGKPLPESIMKTAESCALQAVLYIEQNYMQGASDEARREAAREKLKLLLSAEKISISDAVMDILIDASVAYMNIVLLGRSDKYIKDVKLNE
ncbi:MAG: hypothetical protein K0R80_167 [Clostridia bacterium]|jgi:hypothetical protein|nr:hypothetical protein [Clostridia bacterium]